MDTTAAQSLSLACLAQTHLLWFETEYTHPEDEFDPEIFTFELGVRPSGVVDLWCYINDPYNSSPAGHVGYVYPNGQVCEKVDSEGWPGNYLDVAQTSRYDITYCRELAQSLATAFG